MQGGRGRGDPFFGIGDPFASFGGMPSLFGGRDPFDDPFFTRPLGGMFRPSLFGPAGSPFPFLDANPFGSTLFGPSGNPFRASHAPMIEQQQPSVPNSSRGPIIEELSSDDEKEEPVAGHSKQENPRKHGRSERQPYIEHPDDEPEGREPKQMHYGDQFSIMNNTHSRPQTHSFTFQSSTVTHGGSNGAYYTSSTARRTGSDGLNFEEHKEADSVTGQAAHRLSRGIHDKGHTVARNLNSDGRVDTMQMLHNINEDELAGFEEAWKGKAEKHLPGWTGGTIAHEGYGEPSTGGGALLATHATSSRQELLNHPNPSPSHLVTRRRPDVGDQARSSKARRY